MGIAGAIVVALGAILLGRFASITLQAGTLAVMLYDNTAWSFKATPEWNGKSSAIILEWAPEKRVFVFVLIQGAFLANLVSLGFIPVSIAWKIAFLLWLMLLEIFFGWRCFKGTTSDPIPQP